MSSRISWKRSRTNIGRRNNYADIGLLVLRVSVASLMLFGHGADKLVNFSSIVSSFPDPLGIGSVLSLGLAVFAEFFCSLAIGFGILTRLATIPLMITMLVATFIEHGAGPWATKELAFVYFLIYLAILIAGPGKYSVDRKVVQKNGDG